jgi:hypothetical protein
MARVRQPNLGALSRRRLFADRARAKGQGEARRRSTAALTFAMQLLIAMGLLLALLIFPE